jgi:hypothetical protein
MKIPLKGYDLLLLTKLAVRSNLIKKPLWLDAMLESPPVTVPVAGPHERKSQAQFRDIVYPEDNWRHQYAKMFPNRPIGNSLCFLFEFLDSNF